MRVSAVRIRPPAPMKSAGFGDRATRILAPPRLLVTLLGINVCFWPLAAVHFADIVDL